MRPDELLDQAADEIEWRGWWRMGHGNLRGTPVEELPQCPLTAMQNVAFEDGAPRSVVSKAQEVLADVISDPEIRSSATAIAVWNDSRTDPWEVIDTMRRAARLYRLAYVR